MRVESNDARLLHHVNRDRHLAVTGTAKYCAVRHEVASLIRRKVGFGCSALAYLEIDIELSTAEAMRDIFALKH